MSQAFLEVVPPPDATSDASVQRPRYHLRLRTTLVLPFVVQLTVAVGLVGGLSLWNSRASVNDIASQLRREVANRVRDEVKQYLEEPYFIHNLNAQFFKNNPTLIQDSEALQRHFLSQSRLFNDLGTLAFANREGEFIGANGLENYAVASTRATGSALRRFAITDGDQLGRVLRERPNYDARSRDWYRLAVARQSFAWSEIQPSAIGQRLDVSAVLPIYGGDRDFLGVLLCDLPLAGISQFLQGLQVGKTGQAFIIDRDGLMVAGSTSEPPLIAGKGDEEPRRLAAIQSQTPQLRAAMAALSDRFGQPIRVRESVQMDVQVEGDRHYMEVLPVQDGRGIDWLIIVMVPEADFMDRIQAGLRQTLILCAIALVLSIISGIFTSRWISRAIGNLTQASEAIAGGNLAQRVPPMGYLVINEVDKLSRSFNSMAAQLEQSFSSLEVQKDSFARFFPPEYLNFLGREDILNIELGDHVSKDMAVFFSDIRSFTTMMEQMTPQESFDFVNVYLQRVAPEIRHYRGTIVKFLGDGIMAVFPEAVDGAIAAALAQFERIRELNQERAIAGQTTIRVGMGIHAGHVMVGMVGEYNRMQGDALSDTINLTARLEGLTKFYGASLLISGALLERLQHPDRYQLRFLDRVIVKGRSEAIAIYEVLDAEVEPARSLKQQTAVEFETGYRAFARGDLGLARRHFQAVMTRNPGDVAARFYLERIDRLLVTGLPSGWDGTWTFAEK